MQSAKEAAKQIIEHLSDQASWDEIMYELYVKQKIANGIEAVSKGQVVSDDEARKRLLSNCAS